MIPISLVSRSQARLVLPERIKKRFKIWKIGPRKTY